MFKIGTRNSSVGQWAGTKPYATRDSMMFGETLLRIVINVWEGGGLG